MVPRIRSKILFLLVSVLHLVEHTSGSSIRSVAPHDILNRLKTAEKGSDFFGLRGNAQKDEDTMTQADRTPESVDDAKADEVGRELGQATAKVDDATHSGETKPKSMLSSKPMSADDKKKAAREWQASMVHDGAIRYKGKRDGRRVTIASMFIGDTAKSWVEVQKNHVAFAKLHGYDYFAPFADESFRYGDFSRTRHPTWSKMAIVQHLFDTGSDAVFWTDADSVFINGKDELSNFMKIKKDLIFSGDLNVIFNAGHFLIKKSKWSQKLLREAYAVCPAPGRWMDNSAFIVILTGGTAQHSNEWQERLKKGKRSCHDDWEAFQCTYMMSHDAREHAVILNQNAMNSYETTNQISTAKTKEWPFMVHRVFESADQRARDLPRLARLAIPQLNKDNVAVENDNPGAYEYPSGESWDELHGAKLIQESQRTQYVSINSTNSHWDVLDDKC